MNCPLKKNYHKILQRKWKLNAWQQITTLIRTMSCTTLDTPCQILLNETIIIQNYYDTKKCTVCSIPWAYFAAASYILLKNSLTDINNFSVWSYYTPYFKSSLNLETFQKILSTNNPVTTALHSTSLALLSVILLSLAVTIISTSL